MGSPLAETNRDRPLRILELYDPPDGGIPEHVRMLSEGLADRGHHVTVAGPSDGTPRERIEGRGLRYVDLPIVGDMLALRKDAPSLRDIVSLLARGKFDLIHAHAMKSGLLGRVAATLTRTPAIYTPNSLPHRFIFVRPGPRVKSRFLKTLWMERTLGPATAALVAVSEEERRAVVADRLVPPGRAHMIHNGVPYDDDVPPDARLMEHRGDGPLIGIVAGLRIQKGLPPLLDALETLASAGKPVRFAIVGNGELEDEVRSRIAAGPLAQSTLLCPFAGRVEPYLNALDAFVLPSYFEGLPLAVLEAMAAGLPVVATAVGGTPEAVQDGETGLLVPHDDSEALAVAIRRVEQDPGLRARFGAAGRERWEQHFRVDRMVDETEGLYRHVAGLDR